jgi:ribosome-associated translation inhibitor RaiA
MEERVITITVKLRVKAEAFDMVNAVDEAHTEVETTLTRTFNNDFLGAEITPEVIDP